MKEEIQKTLSAADELKLRAQLFQKLHAAMGEVAKVVKDALVDMGKAKYKAVSHDGVVRAVRGPLLEHKLVLMFDVTGHEHEPIVGVKIWNGQEQPTLTHYHEAEIRMSICDTETGWVERVGGYGIGLDSGDKGYGKAVSYGKKYLLLTNLLLETGEDTDASDEQYQSAQLPPSRSRASRAGNRAGGGGGKSGGYAELDTSSWPAQKVGVPKAVIEKVAAEMHTRGTIGSDPDKPGQMRLLHATASEGGWSKEDAKALLAEFDLDSSKDVPFGRFFTGILEIFKRYQPAVGGGIYEPEGPE